MAKSVLEKHRRFLSCWEGDGVACELEAGVAKGTGKILHVHNAAVRAEVAGTCL